MFLLEIMKAICKRIKTTLCFILRDTSGQMVLRHLKKPAKDADFATWLKYYMDKAGMSQSKLARCARLNQPAVCKIANGHCEQSSMESLVAIILVLQLNDSQAKDLISRIGRAFSPCDKRHQRYLQLIAIYHFREKISSIDDTTILDYADEYLKKYGFDPLPSNITSSAH